MGLSVLRGRKASSSIGGEYVAAQMPYVSLKSGITYMALKAEPPRCFSQPFSDEIAAGEEKAGAADKEAAQERGGGLPRQAGRQAGRGAVQSSTAVEKTAGDDCTTPLRNRSGTPEPRSKASEEQRGKAGQPCGRAGAGQFRGQFWEEDAAEKQTRPRVTSKSLEKALEQQLLEGPSAEQRRF